MTYVPDRPARSPAQAAPTDEECLQYLLAVQQQEMNSSGRSRSSVYSQEGGESPFLSGIGARGRELGRETGCCNSRSPRATGERFPGWDAMVTRSMSPPFTLDSADPRDTWSPPLWRSSDHDSETTTQLSGSVTLQGDHIPQYDCKRHSLIHGTWTAQDPQHTEDIASCQGTQATAQPYSAHSLSPETQGDSDGDDDVYAGWADYYFDDSNFRGRDGVGRYIGKMTGHVRLPTIGEFF